MPAARATDFKHTTAKQFPAKISGYVLLDEEPGFTGIYAVEEGTGLLWPARTVDRAEPHYNLVCGAWLAREGAEDQRTIKEPTLIDMLRGKLASAGVNLTIVSDTEIVSNPDGFYEVFGSDQSPHVGFEATDYGHRHVTIIVKCPIEHGGKREEYHLQDIETAISRIVAIFAHIDDKIAEMNQEPDDIPAE
jgi:hypothetical protein